MNQTIKISASAAVATIDIEGTIGSLQSGDAVATYQELKERLEQIEAIEAPMVVVNICSVGGDVADALTDDVVTDIKETAGENWHSGDVDIALMRVLKKRLCIA